MSVHILNVIDHVAVPSTRAARKARSSATLAGGGRDYFVCGDCRHPIAHGVDRGNLREDKIVCPDCGAVNACA